MSEILIFDVTTPEEIPGARPIAARGGPLDGGTALRAVSRNEPIVFLGWEPHPMNSKYKMSYLAGGDDVFGPDYGGATVYTNVRANYLSECPNVGTLIKNLKFTLPMENEVMGKILFDGDEVG